MLIVNWPFDPGLRWRSVVAEGYRLKAGLSVLRLLHRVTFRNQPVWISRARYPPKQALAEQARSRALGWAVLNETFFPWSVPCR